MHFPRFEHGSHLKIAVSSNTGSSSRPRGVFRRGVAAVLMMTSLTACTTFGPIAPKEYIPIQHPMQIWVTQADNSVIVVQVPKLLGDTLVGYVNGDYQEMLLSQTKQVQTRRQAKGRTALALGAAVAGVAVLGVVISGVLTPCAQWDGATGTWYCKTKGEST